MRKHPLLFGTLLSAAVMIALPVCVFSFGTEVTGMMLILTVWFVVDPIWSILIGMYAGSDAAKRWPLPLISGALFVPGCWMGLSDYSADFLVYAGAYIFIAAAAMLVTALVHRSRSAAAARRLKEDRNAV